MSFGGEKHPLEGKTLFFFLFCSFLFNISAIQTHGAARRALPQKAVLQLCSSPSLTSEHGKPLTGAATITPSTFRKDSDNPELLVMQTTCEIHSAGKARGGVNY